MLSKPDEDLFESSKMSFGEHLDELRSTLIRVIVALAIGMLIGLATPLGAWVVQQIQYPLEARLKAFRSEQAAKEFEDYLSGLEAGGEADVEGKRQDAEQRRSDGLVPEVLWVDPQELAKLLGVTPPEPGAAGQPEDGAAAAPRIAGTEGLAPLTIFRSLDGDPSTRLIATDVLAGFTVFLKAGLLIGAVLASPAIFYFLWSFVASGLYKHERKYVYFFLPFSLGLFLLGAWVAFYFAIGFVLEFLFGFFGWLGIDPTPRIGEWVSFVLLLPLGFGVAFQLPLVMLFLERIAVFTVQMYLSYWRIAILVIFVLSMLLTPSDPGSMLVLAFPLTGLYFGGVALCKYLPKPKPAFAEPA